MFVIAFVKQLALSLRACWLCKVAPDMKMEDTPGVYTVCDFPSTSFNFLLLKH